MDNNFKNPWENDNSWNGRQKVPSTSSFVKGMVIGITLTLAFVIIIIAADALIKKSYIETDDREQMFENAGLDGGADSDELASEYKDVISKVDLIKGIIDRYFYYEENVDKISEGIYAGMLESLDDPYSVYYDEEAFKALMESTSGTYCGIGVVVQQDIETMTMKVINPYKDCPAYIAGIRRGDIIIGVEGVSFEGMSLDEAVTYIRGEENTDVKLKVLRDGEEMEFTVTRKMIDIPTITYELKEGNIAYIKIDSFDDVTYDQFKDALKQAEKDGCKGYIFDVRDNGGGVYDIVVDMLDDLLPQGKIVYTEDKNGKGDTEYSNPQHLDAPMAVLTNGNSASASEIFAGAIQDYGVGRIIGTTTFGKGIVQSVMSLGDGTAIKLTISSYFTPNGRNIHKVGITPDEVVELPEDDSIYDEDGWLKEECDTQMQAAINYLKTEIK